MSRIPSPSFYPNSISSLAIEASRIKRLARKELIRSAGISVGSMVIVATFGLLSPLPAIMFVAGSLIGHGLAMRCVSYECSNHRENSSQSDRVESSAAA